MGVINNNKYLELHKKAQTKLRNKANTNYNGKTSPKTSAVVEINTTLWTN